VACRARAAALRTWLPALLLIAIASGCSSPPAPHNASPRAPVATAAPGDAELPGTVGAADSLASVPGSPGARYVYRFRQTLPGSDHFTFYDRDLSFYFRPAPDALHFQIENKQDRLVWIDWDKSEILAPDGRTSKAAHGTTMYSDRFSTQTAVQIRGLGRYSDYVLPMDYLLDPGASTDQLHKPLLPEDETAPNYNGREFGVDLAFRIDNQPRSYSFRFKVVSVLPR
jgi:hypothetical protein